MTVKGRLAEGEFSPDLKVEITEREDQASIISLFFYCNDFLPMVGSIENNCIVLLGLIQSTGHMQAGANATHNKACFVLLFHKQHDEGTTFCHPMHCPVNISQS